MLSLFLFISFLNAQSFDTVAADLTVVGKPQPVIEAAKPAEIRVKVYDPTGANFYHHFHKMHEKEMHLLLVREDLSTFAHVHPTRLNEHSNIFKINLNSPATDPDNLDLPHAVPYSGKYFVFADTMPHGAPGMVTLPMELEATGEKINPTPLVLDSVNEQGWIQKEIKDYVVSIKPKPFDHCDKLNISLDIKIQKKTDNKITDVVDLDTWLASFAHVILISQEGNTAKEKQVIHMHATWPLPDDPDTERGPDIELAAHSHVPLKTGTHKAWLQFKHQNQITTLPFVFELKDASPLAFCSL